MKSTARISMWILGTCLAEGPLFGAESRRSAVWEAHCTACHGVYGKADTEGGRETRARNLDEVRWQATVSDARLERSIRRGRDKMPAFGRTLTEAEIKALVAEVRALATSPGSGGTRPIVSRK